MKTRDLPAFAAGVAHGACGNDAFRDRAGDDNQAGWDGTCMCAIRSGFHNSACSQ